MMKRKKLVYQLLIIIGMSAWTMVAMAQKERVVSFDFFGLTVDVIDHDNIEYMCSESPLADFDGYQNILGQLIDEEYDPETPVDIDKNYKAKWVVIDKKLYLYDIEMLGGDNINSGKYVAVEKLTNHKFIKEPGLTDNYPNGLMPATWFSGSIYVKRQPASGETYCNCLYRCEPYQQIHFKNGTIITPNRKEHFMEVSMDSMDVYKHPELYIINIRRGFTLRRSRCANILKERLALADNQDIYEDFSGKTIDELLWNNTKYMCSISPISVVDDYKNVYPDIMDCELEMGLPLSEYKNYNIKWTIVNDMLYLYDIDFHCTQKGNTDYDTTYPIRLNIMENFTGKKLEMIPSSDMKGIPATWYSGILYVKRFPKDNESCLNCDYDCEPFYKLDIENGKIKSKEETSFRIIKKQVSK